MTIVRDDDTEDTIAQRMGLRRGPISIDAVVVDAFGSLGVEPTVLRTAILAHGADFSRRRSAISVPGGDGIELYGSLEKDSFRLDHMVCGQVKYFSTKDDDIAHAADYGRIHDGTDLHPELAAGRRMRDVLRDAPFRSRRSPRIASAEHAIGQPLRLNVERTSIEI